MSTRSFHGDARPRASSLTSSRSLPGYASGSYMPENPRVAPRRPATAKTLRSSPLARESSREAEDNSDKGRDKGKGQAISKYRPSRISSTPDLLLSKPSITHIKSSSTDAIVPTPPAVASHIRLPSTSRDPGTNWVTKTDPTPRFSRLGMGGEGVVMPVSAKSHRKTVSRAGSMASMSSSRTPSLFTENVPALTSRTTSFSSTTTSLPTPSDFGALRFGSDARDDRDITPNGKVKRMVSSFFKRQKRTDDESHREPVFEPQAKEKGSMRRKWRTVIASMRR